MEFVVEGKSYSLTSEEIARSGLLAELVARADATSIEITNISEGEFLIAYEYLREGKIPSADEYSVIEYFQISPIDSYELSCVLEDDIRRNMYITDANEKYLSQSYGLQIIDRAFWETFTPKRLQSPEVLFEGPLPCKAEWSEIESRLAELAPYVKEEGTLIAGGAIFAILFGLPIADIDLFYYGINEEEATRRVVDFDACDRAIVLRTKNAISYYDDLRGYTPEVQIILRLYQTRSEILHGFDLASCSLGYEGKNVYITNRGLYALTNLINTVSFDRLSPSYERRLAKYASRGIAIRVPDFDRSLVNLDALETDFCFYRTQQGDVTSYNYTHLTGKAPLDTLLYLEKHLESYNYSKGPQNMVRNFANEACDYAPSKSTNFRSQRNGVRLDVLLEYLEGCEATEECKYAEKINAYLPLLRKLKVEDWHDCVMLSDIPISHKVSYLRCHRKVLPFIVDFDEKVYDILSIVRPFDFPAKLTWKTTQPGEQMTNTFHQIILDDNTKWYNGCYYSSTFDEEQAKAVILPVTLLDLTFVVDKKEPVDITPEMEVFLLSRNTREEDIVYLCKKVNYPRKAYIYKDRELYPFTNSIISDLVAHGTPVDWWVNTGTTYTVSAIVKSKEEFERLTSKCTRFWSKRRVSPPHDPESLFSFRFVNRQLSSISLLKPGYRTENCTDGSDIDSYSYESDTDSDTESDTE